MLRATTGGIDRVPYTTNTVFMTTTNGMNSTPSTCELIYPQYCFHSPNFPIIFITGNNQLTPVTRDVGSDVSNEATGLNRKQPKVYVGFFSHASFPEITKSRKTAFNGECPERKDLLGNEYRSNDWWRLPRREDICPASDIDPDWKYGDATSDPGTNFENICK
ncbi:MAG: hypothetical protein Q9198_003866, partial [Flavoplaca austrocitrina]